MEPEIAEVVPLFGDHNQSRPTRISVEWRQREMSPLDKMRLLRILFASDDPEVDTRAA